VISSEDKAATERNPPIKRQVSRVVADPGEIGTAPQAPFLALPDPSILFAARAARFASLATDNPFAGFLEFMAVVAGAQDAALAGMRQLMPAVGLTSRTPLDRASVLAAGDWLEALRILTRRLATTAIPAPAASALRTVELRPAAELTLFAHRVLDHRFIAEEGADALFLMAALQVAWAARAGAIRLENVAERETIACPLCGATPVASFVGASGERQGLRFLACSLCAAEWRHARIKCTACGSTEGIAYHAIEGHPGPAKAEACAQCRAYAKIVYAERDAGAEPLADDIGSLALDVLMSDRGWRRAYPNPFLAAAIA
jgi:FdhE protein